jgi:hypothetical protein
MGTLFSVIRLVHMQILQLAVESGYRPGLQPVKQPVNTGIVPFHKRYKTK